MGSGRCGVGWWLGGIGWVSGQAGVRRGGESHALYSFPVKSTHALANEQTPLCCVRCMRTSVDMHTLGYTS